MQKNPNEHNHNDDPFLKAEYNPQGVEPARKTRLIYAAITIIGLIALGWFLLYGHEDAPFAAAQALLAAM